MADRNPTLVRFNGRVSTPPLAGPDRALRVAKRGLDPQYGKYAGAESYAELVDAESGEVLETVFMEAA